MKKIKILFVCTMALTLVVCSVKAQPPGGRGPRPTARGGEGSFNAAPLAKDDGEKKILAVLKDLDENQRQGMMNVPETDGRLLRILTESTGAKHVVELGTSNGYSGIWFCLALRTTGGKLTTFEIDDRRAGLAKENFAKAGVENMVTLMKGDAHDEIKKLKEPIDVLFIDADKEGYNDYLIKLLPLVKPGGLIVAHNMEMFAEHSEFVKSVTTNPELETLFLNTQRGKIAISLKKR